MEGDTAPDFTLEAQDGRAVSLHDYRGLRNVVVYFYPKDFTRGCTTEAKTFGLNYYPLKYESRRSGALSPVSSRTDTKQAGKIDEWNN